VQNTLFKQLPQAEQYVGTMPQEEPLETGNSFTTNITSTTTFYAEAGACESEKVVYSKSITCFTAYWCISTSPVLYCQNETAIPLSATPSLDCRLNGTTPNGGTANSTNPTLPQQQAQHPTM
jgi:hypothetical protein